MWPTRTTAPSGRRRSRVSFLFRGSRLLTSLLPLGPHRRINGLFVGSLTELLLGDPTDSSGLMVDGPQAVARLRSPAAVVFDSQRGLLHVLDSCVVRTVDPRGPFVQTVAGSPLLPCASVDDPAVGTLAMFHQPYDLVLDVDSDTLYVTEVCGAARRALVPNDDALAGAHGRTPS